MPTFHAFAGRLLALSLGVSLGLLSSGDAHAQGPTAFRLRPPDSGPGIGYRVPEICAFVSCGDGFRKLVWPERWRIGIGLLADVAIGPMTIERTGREKETVNLVDTDLAIVPFLTLRVPEWAELKVALLNSLVEGTDRYAELREGQGWDLEGQVDLVIARPVSKEWRLGGHAQVTFGGQEGYRGSWASTVRVLAQYRPWKTESVLFSGALGWAGADNDDHVRLADFQAPSHFVDISLGVTWGFGGGWLLRGHVGWLIPTKGGFTGDVTNDENVQHLTAFLSVAYLGGTDEPTLEPPRTLKCNEEMHLCETAWIFDYEVWGGLGAPLGLRAVGGGVPRIRLGVHAAMTLKDLRSKHSGACDAFGGGVAP